MVAFGDGITGAAGSTSGSSSARMINDHRPVNRIKGTLLWVVTIAAWLVMLALVLNSVLGTSKDAKKIRNLDKMAKLRSGAE
jgi:hypothetical protein